VIAATDLRKWFASPKQIKIPPVHHVKATTLKRKFHLLPLLVRQLVKTVFLRAVVAVQVVVSLEQDKLQTGRELVFFIQVKRDAFCPQHIDIESN
jgi:hypothetical protein